MSHGRDTTMGVEPGLAPAERKAAAEAASAAAAAAAVATPFSVILERASRIAIVGGAAMGLIVFLSWAQPILLPIISALVVGSIIGPIGDRAARIGISARLVNALVIAVILALGYGAVVTFGPALAEGIARAPELVMQVRDKLAVLERSLATLTDVAEAWSGSAPAPTVQVQTTETAWVATALSAVTPAFAQVVVFTIALVFFVTSRKRLKRRLVLLVEGRENRLTTLRVFAHIEDRLMVYVTTVAVINLGVGVFTGLALAFLGLPAAPVWGFLAFLLNFLPVVGPLVMKVLLLGLGILTMPTLTAALIPAGLYLVINQIESNFVTPKVVGRSLTLDPLVVFVTVCAFTWLWGPLGAFLAMPLLLAVLIVVDEVTPSSTIELPG